MAQAVGREMLKQRSGSIINITSISGITSSANGPFLLDMSPAKLD